MAILIRYVVIDIDSLDVLDTPIIAQSIAIRLRFAQFWCTSWGKVLQSHSTLNHLHSHYAPEDIQVFFYNAHKLQLTNPIHPYVDVAVVLPSFA